VLITAIFLPSLLALRKQSPFHRLRTLLSPIPFSRLCLEDLLSRHLVEMSFKLFNRFFFESPRHRGFQSPFSCDIHSGWPATKLQCLCPFPLFVFLSVTPNSSAPVPLPLQIHHAERPLIVPWPPLSPSPSYSETSFSSSCP